MYLVKLSFSQVKGNCEQVNLVRQQVSHRGMQVNNRLEQVKIKYERLTHFLVSRLQRLVPRGVSVYT